MPISDALCPSGKYLFGVFCFCFQLPRLFFPIIQQRVFPPSSTEGEGEGEGEGKGEEGEGKRGEGERKGRGREGRGGEEGGRGREEGLWKRRTPLVLAVVPPGLWTLTWPNIMA